MTPQEIINQLSKNQMVFGNLLKEITHTQALWKPDFSSWNLLEVVCHLVDEEKFDFRTRVRLVLEDPEKELPKFNPLHWVREHKYLEQNIGLKTEEFLEERTKSIAWLNSLDHPRWENFYAHRTLGPITALSYLANWLAHDYIHIRQVNRLAYEFFEFHSSSNLSYAGKWR